MSDKDLISAAEMRDIVDSIASKKKQDDLALLEVKKLITVIKEKAVLGQEKLQLKYKLDYLVVQKLTDLGYRVTTHDGDFYHHSETNIFW
jgi:hypothetical protein